MSVVQLENVRKVYHLGETEVHALKGVTLSIGKGEFTAVWGPSGSGKTTLMNLIGVIDEATSGRLLFEGTDVASLSDDRKSELRNRAIGYVFQNFNLVAVLTALENVMLPLQIRGVPAEEAKNEAMARLDQVGLTKFVTHRPDKLSGGQRQRVSIARALVGRPSLVIADEPTANLDSETAMMIVDLMRKLNEEQNTTFIFSTHDDRLLRNVDRRIALHDGLLEGAAQ